MGMDGDVILVKEVWWWVNACVGSQNVATASVSDAVTVERIFAVFISFMLKLFVLSYVMW